MLRNNLNTLLEREGRTVKWLAEKCGVKPHTISLYKSGTRNPSKAVLKLMAQALNCTEAELLSEVRSGAK